MATKQLDSLKRVGENLYVNDHGVYFAWFSLRGKQIKRSLKTNDKTLARRRLGELREKAGRLHGGEQRNIRFEELTKLWLESIRSEVKTSTYDRRVVCINGLTPFFKGVSVRSISMREIERWKIARGAVCAPRTFNKELETLNHLMRYARDVKGILLDNPAEKVAHRKAAAPVVEIPDKGQFRAMVAELRNEPQAVRSGAADFAELLGYSGMRLGEAREIRWCDINFDLNTLLVTGGEIGTKNHEARSVPLFPPLRRLFERMFAERGTPESEEGRIFHFKNIKQALSSACRRAGLPQFGHHDMRHFFCSNAIEAGIDFKAIAGWLGHKDGGVLVAKTYGHLRNEHSAAMAQRMTFDLHSEPKSAKVVEFAIHG
jgi:integrase